MFGSKRSSKTGWESCLFFKNPRKKKLSTPRKSTKVGRHQELRILRGEDIGGRDRWKRLLVSWVITVIFFPILDIYVGWKKVTQRDNPTYVHNRELITNPLCSPPSKASHFGLCECLFVVRLRTSSPSVREGLLHIFDLTSCQFVLLIIRSCSKSWQADN